MATAFEDPRFDAARPVRSRADYPPGPAELSPRAIGGITTHENSIVGIEIPWS